VSPLQAASSESSSQPTSTVPADTLGALLPGTRVRARGLSWEVLTVESAGEQFRLRLRCTEGALRGTETDLLSPFEPVEPILHRLEPRRAGRLIDWRLYHQAFLLEQDLGPRSLVAVEPGRLQIAPYQLVPVMRALEMSRPRLLLADGVGLGKTVQAGLVLAELIARRRAHRVLIVSPAGPLLQQWRSEMRNRFGLRFTVLDSSALQEIRYANELGANPFDHVALGIISLDFAKQERVLQDLERSTFDLIIIDEAHHCMRLGADEDRETSQRYRLAKVLAERADGFLLLSATPHDGFDAHFASLVELLDPSLVDGRGALRSEAYRRHIIRRLKKHIKDPATGKSLFQTREVHGHPVEFSPTAQPAFAHFHKELLGLLAPRLRRALKTKRYAEVLAFVSLLKRSVSTVAACRNTLAVIAERYADLIQKGSEAQDQRKQRLRSLRAYRQQLERYGALSYEEEQDHAALEAEDIAAELVESIDSDGDPQAAIESEKEAAREVRRERDHIRRLEELRDGLHKLIEFANAAEPEDPKLAAVLAQLQRIRSQIPSANVLVYTEYSDSLDAVVAYLNRALQNGALSGSVLALTGQDDEETRTRYTQRFGKEDGLILVSTDATAEGLNLHARCHNLIHVELPYNPNRLEQRNGRIDRYGQTLPPQVHYLYLRGTFEERLLLKLIAKYESQRKRLSFMPNTLGVLHSETSGTTVKLLEGLSIEDGRLFQSPARQIEFGHFDEDADEQNPAYAEMLAEVDRAISGFEKAARTHTWLGDAGMGDQDALLAEATAAHQRGQKQLTVNLLRFVREAVARDSTHADAAGESSQSIVELRLTREWSHGLMDLPGYDHESQRLRLTANAALTEDSEGRSVGFVGRAHPIVRRALDRVRNSQFGAEAHHLDHRISALRSDEKEPELLMSYVGTVQSGVGRAYERVLLVRFSKHGAAHVLMEGEDWRNLWNQIDDPRRILSTKGIWEQLFADWGDAREADARSSVETVFAELAKDFLRQEQAALTEERTALAGWVRGRTETLCGPPEQQLAMFGGKPGGKDAAPVSRWKQPLPDTERLAALVSDAAVASSTRREAAVMLSLFGARQRDLDRRSALQVLPLTPLGMLMLVPSAGLS